jgi:hypothetical protein
MPLASVSSLLFRCQHTSYPFSRWSSHCQHPSSQYQFSVIPLPAHRLPLQPIGHLDVCTQPAWGQYSVIPLPAKHHVHFQHCHLTVSMQPASISFLSFRCQHTDYPFLANGHLTVNMQPAWCQYSVILLSAHSMPLQRLIILPSGGYQPLSVLCHSAVSTQSTLSVDGHLTVNTPLANVSSLSFRCQHTAYPFLANGHLTVNTPLANVSSLFFRYQDCHSAVSTHPTLSADGHLTVNMPLANVSSLSFRCQHTSCPSSPLVIWMSTRNRPCASYLSLCCQQSTMSTFSIVISLSV